MRGVILGVGLGVLAAKKAGPLTRKADSLVKGALLKYLASHATDQVPSPDQAGGAPRQPDQLGDLPSVNARCGVGSRIAWLKGGSHFKTESASCTCWSQPARDEGNRSSPGAHAISKLMVRSTVRALEAPGGRSSRLGREAAVCMQSRAPVP